MPYDDDLAHRIRDLVAAESGVTEKRMFGGLAFLVGGHLAVSASGKGGILVRVDPAKSDAYLDKGEAAVAIMRGRPMTGWLRVGPDQLRTRTQLSRWVQRGVTFARSLPSKS
jgi:hypothetical protein